MNKQEIFDKVCAHLLAQKGKAVGEFDACLYRASDGRKCAVGCLIEDEYYSPAIEGVSVPYTKQVPQNYALSKEIQSRIELLFHALEASGIPEATWPLVKELQQVHDYYNSCNWYKQLKQVGANHGLEMCA